MMFPRFWGRGKDGQSGSEETGQVTQATCPSRAESLPSAAEAGAAPLSEAERLRSILYDIPGAVEVLDGDFNITYQNRAAAEYFGDNVGRRCSEGLTDAGRVCNRCPVRLSLDDGTKRHETVKYSLPGGYSRYMEMDILPLPADGIEKKEVALIATDVNERMAAESRAKDMLSMISHDLKSQMSIVTFNADILTDANCGKPPEAGHDALDAIRKAALNASALMEDFVMLARMECDRLDLETQPFPLSAMLAYVLSSTRKLSGDMYATIHTEIPESLPDVMIDMDRFGRIFTNIITNSIKHGQSGVNIRISAKAEPGGKVVRIEVADDGPGISEKDLPYVFDSYYSSSKGNSGGHGLGLAIVKKFTEMHGGNVEIKSRQGEGTTVILRLPTAPSTR